MLISLNSLRITDTLPSGLLCASHFQLSGTYISFNMFNPNPANEYHDKNKSTITVARW